MTIEDTAMPVTARIGDAARTLRHFARFRSEHGEQWTSRIMLAVTEVNGCALCVYAHTKFALEAGMEPEEVRRLLGGVTSGAGNSELAAIGFAQHNADTRARPERDAWERLVEIYGTDQALGVLGATRMTMWGNAIGIPLSSLHARRKGNPHHGSSLGGEIGATLKTWPVQPIALVHDAVSAIRRQPLVSFFSAGGNRQVAPG